MRKSIRNSGIEIIGDVPWGTHFCQFYQTKEDLTDVLVPYLRAGLENNEFCMWVTSHPLDAEEAKEALRKAVPDFDVYLEKGQIEIIPHTHWYVKEGIFDSERVLNGWVEKLNQALASGYDGLRFTGNTFWLEKKDWNNFIDYEKKVDAVIGKHQMMNLCTYSLDRCDATGIIDIVSNHQFSLTGREGKWEKIENSGRKRAEEAAARAAKDWEQTFDTVPDLIAIIDTEYRVVRANRAMAARLGMTPEEYTGETCYRVIHGTSEPPSFCPHWQLLKDGLEHTAEVCESRLGGYFLVSVSPLHDSEEKLTGSIYVARDINERRQAEKALMRSENEFRTLAENSPDVISRFDRQNRHIYVNPAAEVSYGHSQEEIIGKTPDELGMDPEKARLWERHFGKIFTTGKPETMEFQYKSPQGKEYYFNTRIVPEFVDGEVTSVLAISRDITDIKEAEAKLKETLDNLEELVKERTAQLEKAYKSLKESENGLAEAQRIARIGNWDWNLVTREAYWSEEMYRIFGLDPQKISASYDVFLSYVHPDDRDYVYNTVKEALNGKPYSIDHRVISANGEERMVHEQGEVVFNEENIPVRMTGTVQDITERKKAEEKIQSLANIVESSNDAIGTMSLEGIFTSWNKAAEQIYGYSAEEILGKDVPILEPDNLKGETKQFSEKIKQGDKIHNYKTLRLRKDGTIINVSLTLSPVFDASGKLTDISVIARDITESKKAEEKLQKSEERYRLVTEQTGQLIYDFNFKEDKISWAGAIEEITGYSPEEFRNFDFAMWVEHIHPEDMERVTKTISEARKKGRKFQEEYRFRRKNGYYTYVNVVGTYLPDEDGHSHRVVGVVKDITERKEAEEALAKIETVRKKEIHHRIKNNLQVISSLLNLQAEKFSNRECVKDSEVLEAFRESQDRVISMALIHEELYRGGEADTLNFSQYLEKLVENLFQTYRFGNADISLNTDLEENVFFDMDTAIPLGIIINELVSNSLKHAFPGGNKGNIKIKLSKEEKGECKNRNWERKRKGKSTGFTLTVSDNGVGIPENIDCENSETLGLQLVSILVNQLEGELELKRNNGTEFTIRFTVAEKE